MQSITRENLAFIINTLRQIAGIDLSEEQEYLIIDKLSPVAKLTNHATVNNLINTIRIHPSSRIMESICDALTTNETLFFRDKIPFDTLKNEILPEVIHTQKDTQKLRIWSAACSSGQEPYSIAILIAEHFPELTNWNIEILASDISERALKKAEQGVYREFEIQRGLTPDLIARYFTNKNEVWQILPRLREQIYFERRNLLDPFHSIGPVDIVFCRYVLIYFDTMVKKLVLDNIASILSPNGYLFLGSAESVVNVTGSLERVPGTVPYYRQHTPQRKISPLDAGKIGLTPFAKK